MLGLLKKKKKLRRRKKFSFPKLSINKKGFAIFIVLLLLIVGGVAAFGYFALYQPGLRVKAKAEEVVQAGKQANAVFKENDLEKLKNELDTVEATFDSFQAEAESMYWMKPIPVLGNYIEDLENGVVAGDHLVAAAKKTVVAIEPHADLIGFKKGEDTAFIDKPAELRLQTAVLTLDKIVQDVDVIAEDVDVARQRIDAIDPKRYPHEIRGIKLRESIAKGKSQFEGLASLFVDSKPFLKSLPDILGAEDEKTYLILFMNDKELRPTGGFLTAYAVFTVNQGKFTVQRSDDIYTLDASIRSHPAAPEKIAAYHKNVSKFWIRDSNLSPDFVESIALFDELYQNSSHREDYDGVIAVDTQVLVDSLKILGDTQVRGINFSADMDERCNCPQVIYKLLDEIDRPVAYLKADRKGILGDFLFILMQKALGFSPSKYWGQLIQDVLMKNLEEKHIIVYMKDEEVQKSLEALNFAGRIQDHEEGEDYLHISDTNFAGAKSNLFVKHEVVSETTIKDDGTVERTVTVEYKNPEPHSNCNLEDGGGLGRGGLCINATLRNWFRIYVPEGSTLVDFNGSETDVETYEDLDKTVFEGFFGVKPEGKATATITYTLPFKVQNTSDYKLKVQKQPGTVGHDYTILLNGKKLGQLDLTTDQVFSVQ